MYEMYAFEFNLLWNTVIIVDFYNDFNQPTD